MQWRPIGSAGESYPAWVRELKQRSGVYAIREKAGWITSARVVYVGESHTGNLYKTLTRHFASWRRGKKWWFEIEAFKPRQTDPGHTYDRADVEVAILVFPSGLSKDAAYARAMKQQTAWIQSLEPRDNLIGGGKSTEAGADGW